jgi:putative transposase
VIQRAYKYRIYPDEEQTILLQKTFGCVRFVYNQLLAENNDIYQETGKGKINTPAHLKKEYTWLKEVDSLALCNAQIHLKNAFFSFFRRLKEGSKKLGFPKFKSKKTSKKSYTTNNINNSIRIEKGKLRLPKLGLVNTVFHRYCKGIIKSVIVSQSSSGHYFVSILTEENTELRTYVFSSDEKVEAIDMSFSECGIMSEKTRNKFIRFYRLSEKKISKANKELHRKVKGSKNRNKIRIKLSKVHEKLKNQRNDFLNKLSYELAEKFDVIVVEDINMQNLSKCLKNGKSVYDIAFGTLRNMLEYKLIERGKILVKAPKYFPSTQLCSVCGYKNETLKNMSIREYFCPNCGTFHNRDKNSCANLIDWYKNTRNNTDATSVYACGGNVRLQGYPEAITCEAGKVDKQDLSSPSL